MTALWRGFDRLLDALAVIAALLIPFMFLSIVYDVTSRTLRVGQISWVLGVTEYALLYVSALGAPWLLREKGHASMEAIRTVLPSRLARPMERLVLVLCAAGCAVVTVAVVPVLLQNVGVTDIRSNYLSRWMLYAAVLACFALCTLQFLRFLVTGTSPYQGISAEQESL
ncbi:TRAP transporter small permease [Jannaschia formosa]|uniref:TRAP transporter small permease n=1 Tax=Jannaschia formosa TaxID=2259592 RepID=UPI000E1B5398|nr:TRAP transporter small permease [Jannaschia formosa]TFL16512.1 TRAP transporter small permease [Jannaschia formosa]